MRDLGLMGESTFSLWCADAGLIPNGSQVDKTGWDFFVEFPYETGLSPHEVHKPALECKVQVKATDKRERKMQISLSNLRRLITAQMPAFFVFIEFDGKDHAQSVFVVHVDNKLISKVLKRLHTLEQSNKSESLNKRTITIVYGNDHRLKQASGECLKTTLLSQIGSDVSEYIAKKKLHLQSTGYEDGFAQLTFTTEGEDNLRSLIDVSLGIEREVNVSTVKGVNTRFGVMGKSPMLDVIGGKLSMPDLKPTAYGRIRFREDKLSAGLTFDAKLFISPFNVMIPDEMKKIRLEGEFFDLIFNPYTGSATYSFSCSEGVRLEVARYRDAMRLLNLLSSSGRRVKAELIFDGFPKLEFAVGCKNQEFDFSEELSALESAVRLISLFDVTDSVDISFTEINQFKTQIRQLDEIFTSPVELLKAEFSVDGGIFELEKSTACIFLITAPVGSHIFGALVVMIGDTEEIESERYRMVARNLVIEQKIVSAKDEPIINDDLVAAVESIERKYSDEFSVVTMFDRKS